MRLAEFAPPMTPKKMNATFAQVTQKLVTMKVTDATCTLRMRDIACMCLRPIRQN